jgi:hypothetical protein
MAYQGHGMHLLKGYVQEGSYPSLVGYGKISTKKKKGWQQEKRR